MLDKFFTVNIYGCSGKESPASFKYIWIESFKYYIYSHLLALMEKKAISTDSWIAETHIKFNYRFGLVKNE